MAYADLKTDIVEILKDSQVDDAKAGDFIRRAEFKLQRDLMNGGNVPRQMLARLTTTSTTNSNITLPTDFLKARTVQVNGIGSRYAAPALVESNANGYADASVVLDYYQLLPALSDSNTTNWLLDVGFDVYLWAACLQYVPWGQEDDVFQQYLTWYQDALNSLKMANGPDPRGSFSGGLTQQYGGHYTIIGDTMLFGR